MTEEAGTHIPEPERPAPAMHEREIELADGRYLIFFTFDEKDAAAAAENGDV